MASNKQEPWALTGRPLPIPRRTKSMRDEVRKLDKELLQHIIDSQERSSLERAAELLGVRPEELVLYHEGNEGPSLSDELRAFAEREIARTIFGPFQFESVRFFRWFVVQSRILWRYYGACPQLETWNQAHFIRGLILPSYRSYLHQVARAYTLAAKQNAENDRFIEKHFRRQSRTFYIGHWRDDTRQWLFSQGLADRTNRTLERWVQQAAAGRGWKASLVALVKDREETNRPTSLKNPLSLKKTKYLEVWNHYDDANTVTQGHWIVLGVVGENDYQALGELFTKARLEIGTHPQFMGAKLYNRRHVAAGPFFDVKVAEATAARLKKKDLATGEIVTRDLELLLRRPASRDQWWRPRQ